MQSIRIIEIPKCKMVSSGAGMFGQEKFGRFSDGFQACPKLYIPRIFSIGMAPHFVGCTYMMSI